jgi:hypothetical protein
VITGSTEGLCAVAGDALSAVAGDALSADRAERSTKVWEYITLDHMRATAGLSEQSCVLGWTNDTHLHALCPLCISLTVSCWQYFRIITLSTTPTLTHHWKS